MLYEVITHIGFQHFFLSIVMKLFTPRSLFLSSIIGLSLIYSCKKGELSKGIIPEESNAPVLFLNNSTGYAQNGDTVQVGHLV